MILPIFSSEGKLSYEKNTILVSQNQENSYPTEALEWNELLFALVFDS